MFSFIGRSKLKEEDDTVLLHVPPPEGYQELTPSLTYKSYHIVVDSKDRDKDYWASNNPFQFTLGPSSVNLSSPEQSNTIYRSFADVHALTVKKLIIPYTNVEYPYLLFVVNELGSNINGTNNIMNNAFGYLTHPVIVGEYSHYSFDENFESVVQMGQESHMTKIFSPRIEISRLTFNIQTPEGKILDFANDKSVVIEIQVICLRKELDNTLLVKPS